MTTTNINKVRTAVRRDSRLTKNVVGSLQICKLDENEDLLTKKINVIDEHAELQDSAWDKKVLKVVLGATRSRNQLQELGIGSYIQQYTKSVLETIQEKRQLKMMHINLLLEILNG